MKLTSDQLVNAEEYHELEGPVLLLAGPGTGKTYRLIKRIKFLVEDIETDPEEITVITFTAAAAANMRMRISDKQNPELFVPMELQPSTICTMHSLGHRIITDKAPDLGLSVPVSVMWSDLTRDTLMGDAAQLVGLKRVDGQATAECRQFGHCHPNDSQKCKICETYGRILRTCNAVDHDDQILLACEILREDEKLLSKYQKKAKDLLIDEYQDINSAQFELIKLLTKGQLEGLFAVGDDDQSIYSWRGGSPEFIRDFEDHFGKEAEVLPLTHSYRCNRNILEGARAIVKKYDKERKRKGRFTYEQSTGSKIFVHNVPSDKREARIVVRIIQEALPSKRVLVLVPRRAFASHIIKRLRQLRIEYIAPEPLPGEGLPSFARLAVWLNDEDDSIALRDCMENMLNSKALGVPSRRVRRTEKKEQRERAFSMVSRLWDTPLNKGTTLWNSLESNYNSFKLLISIHQICSELKSADKKDVPEFLKVAATYLEPWAKTDSLMEEMAAWVNRYALGRGSGPAGSLRIMTLEGAKGLEADVVCVMGMEDGAIPNEMPGSRGLDEYSRLMYVSMTRAKGELHLFHSRKRSGAVSFQQLDHKGGSHTLKPSRFLDDIPDNYKKPVYHKPRS